ncbi:MAG: hypothetical protein IIY69_04895, partial [Clostridia bacterium]|nr:hypothetical protein [Clostridia bacterium]
MKRITKMLLSILTVIAMIIWVFPVFSLADSGDASYVLTGLNYTANGIFKNNDPAGYWISGTNSEEIWKDGAVPPKSLISAFSTRLATSTSFSTDLKDDPVTGKSYYFKITIRNEIAENHAVDFSQLTAENCRLDITG